MADYNSSYTGIQIDTAVGKALNPDTIVAAASSSLITSGAVASALATIDLTITNNSDTTLEGVLIGKSSKVNIMSVDSNVSSGSSNLITSGAVASALLEVDPTITNNTDTTLSGVLVGKSSKIDVMAVDSAVTSGSSNLVTSDAVAVALASIDPTITSNTNTTLSGVFIGANSKVGVIDIDSSVNAGSSKLITSGAVASALLEVDPTITNNTDTTLNGVLIGSNSKVDSMAVDTAAVSSSSNLITSGAVYDGFNERKPTVILDSQTYAALDTAAKTADILYYITDDNNEGFITCTASEYSAWESQSQIRNDTIYIITDDEYNNLMRFTCAFASSSSEVTRRYSDNRISTDHKILDVISSNPISQLSNLTVTVDNGHIDITGSTTSAITITTVLYIPSVDSNLGDGTIVNE